MKTIIIGGGAAGVVAAVKIKQNNPQENVTILEHLDEILKKIYATGNGRCNLTNKNAAGYETVKSFFENLGLMMKEDGDGRIYPYSFQASTVANLLINACKNLGIEIITNCDVKKAEYLDKKYHVYTNFGIMQSDVLIIATGGKSQSSLGSDGSGYAFAKGFGHSITELSPALVQLCSSSKHCKALKGTRTKCNIKIENNGMVIGEEYGELLFTDYGISGIVVMNLSNLVSDTNLKNGKNKTIAIIDLVPELTVEELQCHIDTFGDLEGILPHKLCAIIDKQVGGEKARIAGCAKNWRIIITGTKGYNFAQITSGGVETKELDENNKSKLCPNLYIIGEITDNQFECGGFNLNYAFFSGINAANDITK